MEEKMHIEHSGDEYLAYIVRRGAHFPRIRGSEKHPVQVVYPEHTSPVVLGTDNALNFSTSFQRDKALFLDAFPCHPENRWKYRFG